MTRNCPQLGFETTEDDHCLPTCLSFNLLNGDLNCESKIVDCTAGWRVSAGSRQRDLEDIPLGEKVLREQVVSVFAGFLRPWESPCLILQHVLLVDPVVKRSGFGVSEESVLPTHYRHMEQ